MKNNLARKGLVISVILLFIGVAVAPTINFTAVKASTDSDLVEVTTQACGIQGYGNTTVRLTKQQYQDLEQYLVEFRARLNQTSTRKEAVPIFKDAVVELNNYGLLPKGMSVEHAQRLVIGLYQNTNLIKYLEKLSNTSEKSLLQEGNKFCLIYGKDYGQTIFQGFIGRTITCVLWTIANNISYVSYIITEIIVTLLSFPILFFDTMSILFAILFSETPLAGRPFIGASIFFGTKVGPYDDIPPSYKPASGDIWTNGLYGVKNWTGTFYGTLPSLPLFFVLTECYPGVNGFIGLRLYLKQTDIFFGYALNVNVGPNHP
jgi:hypothetical protein